MSLIHTARQATQHLSSEQISTVFKRPIFVISTPRSGSTLLFENLIQVEGYWSIGAESHSIFNQFPHLSFENRDLDSGALMARHADEETKELMKRAWLLLVGDHQAKPYLKQLEPPVSIQFIEKTPRNALNIPFILSLFPDARFIYLYRDPRQNIASMVEAWDLGQRTGQFVTFPVLPEFDKRWCFLLPRGWKEYRKASITEIASFQWAATNQAIMSGLSELSSEHWIKLSYQEFVDDPNKVLANLHQFAFDEAINSKFELNQLALSRTTVSPPNPDKWRRFESEILAQEPLWEPVYQRVKDF